MAPLFSHAQPLPPALAQRQAALQSAQQALEKTEETQNTLAQKHTADVQTLHHALTRLLMARRLSPKLLNTLSISHPHTPPTGTLLAAATTQQAKQIQGLNTKLAAYLATTRQAHAQLTRLQQLSATFSQGQGQLHSLEKQALLAATLSANTLTQTLSQPLPTAPTGPLSLPSTLPVMGRIVSSPAHPDGLTFETQPHETVTSVGAGQVIYSGPFQHFGGLVIVRATGQHYLLYAQLATLSVTAGQTVQPGQPLGTLGPTAPSRLFFQVRRRGRPIPALAYLSQA